MNCLTEDEVLAFVAQGAVDRAAVEHHLDGCAECMELVTLAAQTSIAKGSGAPPPVRTLAAHSHVGRYEIEEPRGRGAMGTVYAALDTQLDRRVAVKLVEPGDDRAQVALLREAKALARVAHPNVLAVYDFGVFETHVFLVAELVDGETLAAWSVRPHPWREIAGVYLAAARGLAAAHAAGLVHRDFKPANVLIGKDARVRVCDFGLARFTDTTPTAKELVGTPVYMAPEQRRGEVVDARADQYGFCIALHEALHGVLPPRGERRIPSWLAAIIARGLAPAPDARFPTMTALATALERGLHRRRRRAIAGVAAAGIAIATATTALAYGRGGTDLAARCPAPALASWTPVQRIEVFRAFAATELVYAPALASRVGRVLDRFATRYAIHGHDVCLAGELHTDDAELHARRIACLDRAHRTFDAIVDRFRAPRHTRLLLEVTNLVDHLPDLDACARPGPATPGGNDAALLSMLARIQTLALAGELTAAANELPAAKREAEALGDKRQLAHVHYVEAQLAGERGAGDEAARGFEAALWEAQAAGDDLLVASAAGELLRRLGMAGRDADVQKFRALALATAERIGSLSARARIARAVGQTDLAAGRFAAAEELLVHARELEEARMPRDDYELAAVLTDLGDLEYRRGDLAKAEPLQRRAVELFAQEVGLASPTMAAAVGNLANTLADRGKLDEARQLYAQALEIRERALGADALEVAQTLSNAAGLAVQAGELAEAQRDLERALAIDRRHHDVSPTSIASVLHNLGEVAGLEDQVDVAIAHHTEALALRTHALGAAHPLVIDSELALADLELRRGGVPAARRHCEAAHAAADHADPGAPPPLGAIETCLGRVELASHHAAAAIALLEHALARSPEDPDDRATIELALARALDHGPRAVGLANEARAVFANDGILRKRELAEVDAWLATR